MTREDFARIANKAFGEHPECEPGTDEFLAILGVIPSETNGSGVGQKATEGISRSHNPRYAQRLVIPGGSR